MEAYKIPSKVSEVKLVYKTRVRPENRVYVRKSMDAYQVLLRHWDEEKIELVEEFKVILLNQSNGVLGILNLSSGGLTSTIADVRHIFVSTLKANACCLILAHNHPSGNLTPSTADKAITEKVKAAGELLEIRLSDHLIISSFGYFSFADEGLI